MSTSYAYCFVDPKRLAEARGCKDARLEAAVCAMPRCWDSDDNDDGGDHAVLAEIIEGDTFTRASDEPERYVLVCHWIALTVGQDGMVGADEDDGEALENDLVQDLNAALVRVGEAPFDGIDPDGHPCLADDIVVSAAESVAVSVFAAEDCTRVQHILEDRWSAFSADEVAALGPFLRLLQRRRHHDVLMQLMF